MNVAIGTSRKRQTSNSLRVCVSMPFAASITITAESTAVSVRYVSSEKSSCPGVSSRLNTRPSNSNVITEVTTEMPRSRSIFIQSERVLRRSPLALTGPARLMAPPNSSSFSVSVVLPASGCEMIAKVRRRATSAAIGERGGDSAGRARSDIARAFGRETGLDQGGSVPPHIRIVPPNSRFGLSHQQHRPVGQGSYDRRGRNGDDPGIDDRTGHVPAHRRDPPRRSDADNGAGDGMRGRDGNAEPGRDE